MLGLKVCLIDKSIFPRDKICGDALSGTVPYELNKLGLEIKHDFNLSSFKLPTSGIRFFSPEGKFIDVNINNVREGFDAPGYVASRYDFDNMLIDVIRRHKNIHLLENFTISNISLEDKVSVSSSDCVIYPKIVVGADGANSITSKLLGNTLDKKHHSAGLRQYYSNVDGFSNHNHIELHFYENILPGYFWIFPMTKERANVGIGMLSSVISKKKINLKQEFLNIIQHHPLIAPRFKNAVALETPKGFGLPLGSRKINVSGDRIILVGDAASLIDPFSGEGIGNAMTSGRIAANHIVRCFESNRFDADFNKIYQLDLYKKMGNELSISFTMQKLLQFPFLFNVVVRKARTNKHLQELIESMMVNESNRKQLTNPIFYLKLLFNLK